MMNRKSFLAAGLASLVTPFELIQAQQSWPTKSIKFIVPLTPGGSNDLLARLLAEKMQINFGQTVVVDNKPGAGGNIGTEFVAKQPADGYTILLSANTHVMNVNFFKQLPYDPVKDFQPISMVGLVPFVLTVNAQTPVNNLNEFLSLAKAKGNFSYGTAGIGTPHHLAAEMLKSMTGIEMIHVPYKGAAGIVQALLSNEITCTIGAINSLIPHINSGKLKAIAVASNKRTSLLPDVPSIAEAGPLPGYGLDVWAAVLAPAGTPRVVVDRLNTEIVKIINDPQVIKERLFVAGIEPMTSTPERAMEIIKADLVKYSKIAKMINIKPE